MSTATEAPSETRRPTNRQWWKIAQEALRLLEQPAPTTRHGASELIDKFCATQATEEAPF